MTITHKIPEEMSIRDVLKEIISDVDFNEVVTNLDYIACDKKLGRIVWVKHFEYPDNFNTF